MPKTKVKPKKSTKSPTAIKNQIAIVLDCSGSMQICARETVDALNNQIQTIRSNSDGMDTKVTLVKFATRPDEPQFFNQDVSVLKEITYEDYQPNGGTAMFDAVGQTIDMLKALNESKDTSFLVIIISDGQENASQKFTRELIAERVQELQDTKHWTFTYLGANQDLADLSKSLCIPIGNMQSFAGSAQGMNFADTILCSASTSYLSARRVGATSVRNFYSGNGTADAIKKDDTTDDSSTTDKIKLTK